MDRSGSCQEVGTEGECEKRVAAILRILRGPGCRLGSSFANLSVCHGVFVFSLFEACEVIWFHAQMLEDLSQGFDVLIVSKGD